MSKLSSSPTASASSTFPTTPYGMPTIKLQLEKDDGQNHHHHQQQQQKRHLHHHHHQHNNNNNNNPSPILKSQNPTFKDNNHHHHHHKSLQNLQPPPSTYRNKRKSVDNQANETTTTTTAKMSLSSSRHSRSSPLTGSSESLSSSSSSSCYSLVTTGCDLGPSSYNPSDTLPLPDTNFFQSHRKGLVAAPQKQPDDIRDKQSKHLAFKKELLKNQALHTLAFRDHPNPHVNSTILTLGSATMFSSASLLTLPAASNIQSPPKFVENTNKASINFFNGMNGSTIPNANSAQSPWTTNPLINETRTRALSRAKLKQSSHVSALLSGFALVAMVEMDIQSPSTLPLPILIFFIIITTLLVSVHMIALMISTCILPHIESMHAMQDVALTLIQNNPNPESLSLAPSPVMKTVNGTTPHNNNNEISTTILNKDQSDGFLENSSMYGAPPHQKMRRYISIAWFFSTVIGIFLFIIELVAIVWVKFWDHNRSRNPNEEDAKWISDGVLVASVATFLLVPVLLSLIYFAFHFYRKLVLLRYEMTQKVLDELNMMADGLSVCEQV